MTEFDPCLTAIIATRMESIIQEMTQTLLRATRSTVINSARDFSCSICTADNQLLMASDGLPIHLFGSHLQTGTMTEFHAGDIQEGDCYLHNDPYNGNTHAADHGFLVPVFFEGEHLFTAVAKAHQADIGNAEPTNYMAGAADIYEEGALIFPAVRVQRNYRTQKDIVRMCRARIRVPDQWYGDFLAAISSARSGERRLKELCEKYGRATIKAFSRAWLDYSERRMEQVIRGLPAATLLNSGTHDPFGTLLPKGIPLTVGIGIDPEAARITLDLTDNIDNVNCGFNASEATATSAVLTGVFNSIDSTVPRNSGSFRRITVMLREGSVAGKPAFPHSCSVATTNVADRLVNIVQSAFAKIGDGWGLAEGGVGQGAGLAVVSGKDPRAKGRAYVNQMFTAGASGPGCPTADGWPTYTLPVVAGLPHRDAVEVDELKYPVAFRSLRVLPGTGGAGRFRGAPAIEVAYGPREVSFEAHWPCDGTYYPANGVRGGQDGQRARHFRVKAGGERDELPNVVSIRLQPGEYVIGQHASGGGYGDPLERDPTRVVHDVLEGYENAGRARDVYGVVLAGSIDGGDLAVNVEATYHLRKRHASEASTAKPDSGDPVSQDRLRSI